MSGNVNINKILYFSGDLTINTRDLKLLGNCRIYVTFNGYPINLWDGSIDCKLQNAALTEFINPAGSALKLSGLNVRVDEINMLSDGVGVKGVLKFPDVPCPGCTKGAQISLTNIQVSRSNGIRFVGGFQYPGPIRLGAMNLRDLNLSVDNIGNNFSGAATVEIPNFMSIGGSLSVYQGALNSVGLSFGLTPGIPIDATGLRLVGGSGQVNHISDGQGLSIGLTADLKGGFEIGGVSVVEFNQFGFTVWPRSALEANGKFKVFGKNIAEGNAAYRNRTVSCGFVADIGGFYNSKFVAALENGRISGSGDGVLKVPSLPALWKWTGLGGKQIASVQTQFKNNEVSGNVGIPQICKTLPLIGKKCTPSRIAFKLEYAPQDAIPVHFWYAFNADPLKKLFRKSLQNGNLIQEFSVDSNTTEAWFMVHGLSGIAPDFELISPNGSTLDSTNAPFFRFDEDGVAFYILDIPTPGKWQVYIPSANSSDVEIEGLMINAAPRIVLTEPAAAASSNLIRWIDSDGDDNAHINLYYDIDDQGFDGTLLTSDSINENDATNSYLWNTSSVSPGNYHIYAVISDTSNAPYAVYAPGTITVANTYGLTIPTGFQVIPTDTSLQLSWSDVSDSINGFVLHYSDDSSSMVLDKTIAFGDTNIVELFSLIPGRTYKMAVCAYDTAGHEGELSNSVVVEFKNMLVNNPPHITTTEPPDFAVIDAEYSFTVDATDLDGDPLVVIPDSVPSGMLIASGSVTWTPDASQLGPQIVRLVVTDNRGGYDSLSFTISVIDAPALVGSVEFDKGLYIGLDDQIIITLDDFDRDVDPNNVDSIQVTLTSSTESNGIPVWLRETGSHTSQFAGTAGFDLVQSSIGLRKIKVRTNDTLKVTYLDTNPTFEAVSTAVWQIGNCCINIRGNVNGDSNQSVNVVDLTYLVAYLFNGGIAPSCKEEGDVNGNGSTNVVDITYLVNYLFKSGPAPLACP